MSKTMGCKIENLKSRVTVIMDKVKNEFIPLNHKVLNSKLAPEKWSSLECFQHLNRYSEYYNPAIEKVIFSNKTTKSYLNSPYKESWLGKKFVDMVRPINSKKIKTLKHMNPLGSALDHDVLNRFLNYQENLLDLLGKLETVDLRKNKISIEFFKLLKIRLGDVLEFVVTHEERHLIQAQTVLREVEKLLSNSIYG